VQAIDLTLRTQPELIFMDLGDAGEGRLRNYSRNFAGSKEVFGEVPIVALSASAFDFHGAQSIAAGCAAFSPSR